MITIKSFTFNDFAENTYIISDESKECIIIDPGCSNKDENDALKNYIIESSLKPVMLLNTHCHIDHVLGNKFVSETWGLPLTAHKKEASVLASGITVSEMYRIPYDPSPEISRFIDEGDTITFGTTTFSVIFTPGHSPASVSLYCSEAKVLIAGDVLFAGSIGRTDLPGGNFETLTRVIRSRLFTLPDETIVYPGHGPSTNIGIEKRTNPFF